jgi:hypothetical protein
MVLMVKSLDRMGRAAVPAGRLVVYLYGDAAEESPTATLCWEGGRRGWARRAIGDNGPHTLQAQALRISEIGLSQASFSDPVGLG